MPKYEGNSMIESFKKNKKGILLMALSSVFVCIGQLEWKLAVERGHIFIVIGFCLYAIGAFLMITAYRYGKLSILQPMLSLNYVLSIVLAGVILHETITSFKIAGVAIIMIGVLLIAGGDIE